MTTPFTVYTLFSGSKGNCTYIRAKDTEILVDAGVSAKAIECALREIGSELSRISAILVTHEHCDHVKGLEMLCKRHEVPVHITACSASHMNIGPCLSSCAVLHDARFELTIGPLLIRSFPAPHDSACCVGYRMECDGHAIAIATDLGRITKEILNAFLGTDGVVVESNHDVDLLLQNPIYPPYLKERILSGCGHLSNDLAARFLAYLAKSGTRYALLAHLSRENNTPALALDTLSAKLSDPMKVSVAEEKHCTCLF